MAREPISVSTLIWGKAVTNAERFFPQTELRGLKVLPPHGAEATLAADQDNSYIRDLYYCTPACLAADYLNCAIARNAPTRLLRSASDATLAVTVPRTVGRSSFAMAKPTIWNSLPRGVRSTETPAAFRKQLKPHLFRLFYLP